jgi:predicted Zn finger-like uncharacterized protein
MSLRTSCPSCKANFNLPDTAAGKKARCAKCGQVFLVPDAGAAEAEALPVLELADEPDNGEAVQSRPDRKPPALPRFREEPDSRPRRRPARPRRRPQKDSTPLVICLSLVGGVLLIGAVVGVAYWVTSAQKPAGQQFVAAPAPPPVNPPVVFNPGPPPVNPPGFAPPPNPFPGPGGPAPGFPNPPNVGPPGMLGPGNPPGGIVPPKGPPIPPGGFPGIPGAKPPTQPEDPGPPLPPFQEPPNPYRAGSQTKLRPTRTLPAADPPVQLVYSPKHELLFRHDGKKALCVTDVKAGKDIDTRSAVEDFSDLHLSPDQSALYVADYGRTNIGYATPMRPSHVHRYDLAARKWERRQAPKIAFRIEVVDPWRFLLLEQDQWVSATVNRWEQGQDRLTELSRVGSNYAGDIEYDPRTGRMYHGNSGISSPEIHVFRLAGNKLQPVAETGTYGTASKAGGGGSAVLASDGSCFYYGKLQVDANDVKNNRRNFLEVILAASRDLAFGEKGYYNAHTGEKVADVGFATRVQAVSPDGMFVWVYNPTSRQLHQFAIEGQTKEGR